MAETTLFLAPSAPPQDGADTTCVRPGRCFAPMHWNDLFGENLAVNAATSGAVDEISLQPEFEYGAVTLTKIEK